MIGCIVAAGEGSRMYPFSSMIPKCMVPINGVPLIQHQITHLMDSGVNEIVVCVNEKDKKQIFNHLKLTSELFGFKFDVSSSDTPLGTAGELAHARQLIEAKSNNTFLIYYGDIFTDFNISKMTDAMMNKNCLGLVKKTKLEISMIDYDKKNHQILSFVEKPNIDKYTWSSIALLKTEILGSVEIGQDFGFDVFPKLVKSKDLYGFADNNAVWYDVGNYKQWEMINKMLGGNR